MTLRNRILLLLFALVFTACPYWSDDYEFEYTTIVTDSPVNLEGINSAYDDYNSDLPYPYQSWNIFFSSNRKSKGVHFDIIHRSLFLSYHEKDDVLDVHFGNPGDLTTYETQRTINWGQFPFLDQKNTVISFMRIIRMAISTSGSPIISNPILGLPGLRRCSMVPIASWSSTRIWTISTQALWAT